MGAAQRRPAAPHAPAHTSSLPHASLSLASPPTTHDYCGCVPRCSKGRGVGRHGKAGRPRPCLCAGREYSSGGSPPRARDSAHTRVPPSSPPRRSTRMRYAARLISGCKPAPMAADTQMRPKALSGASRSPPSRPLLTGRSRSGSRGCLKIRRAVSNHGRPCSFLSGSLRHLPPLFFTRTPLSSSPLPDTSSAVVRTLCASKQ